MIKFFKRLFSKSKEIEPSGVTIFDKSGMEKVTIEGGEIKHYRKNNCIKGLKYLEEKNIGDVQDYVPQEYLKYIPEINKYGIKYGGWLTILESGDIIVKESEDNYRVYKLQTHKYQVRISEKGKDTY